MPQALGKLSLEALASIVTPRLGAGRPEVLLGPAPGTDAAVVRVGAGRVLAATTDPISLVPALGIERSARMSCRLVASDLWTSGIPPAYAAVTLNLPRAVTDEALAAYLQAMHEEWQALGIAVITGHTGRVDGVDSTVIGACTLLGIGDEGRWVGPPFVRPGDQIVLTKGCAIEAAAVVAHAFPERLAARLEFEPMERARELWRDASVVADCRAVLRVGVRDRGVSALHDATEGGVLGGLLELARASGHDLRIERARIPLSAEVAEACRVLEVDPYVTLSTGALIVAVRPDWTAAVLEALAMETIPAAVVGSAIKGHGIVWLTEPDGSVRKISEAPADQYWEAYARGIREGWS